MLQKIFKDWIFLVVAGVLLLLFAFGMSTGRRLCNCKTTEQWKPGEQRGAHRVGGYRTGFYHK